MITHGTEGDAFWSVVKNGAEAAGRELGVKVTYVVQRRPGRAGQAHRQRGGAGQDRASSCRWRTRTRCKASIEAAVRRRHPGHHDQLRRRPAARSSARIAHVGQDEKIAGRGRGRAVQGRRQEEAALRHPRGRQHRPERALRRRARGLRRRRWRTSRSTSATPPTSRPASRARCRPTRRSTRVLTLNLAGRRQRGRPRRTGAGSEAAGRHVRPEHRRGRRHPGRPHPVRRRPAAVRAGLPADHDAEAVPARTATRSAAGSPCSPARASSTSPMRTRCVRTPNAARAEERQWLPRL